MHQAIAVGDVGEGEPTASALVVLPTAGLDGSLPRCGIACSGFRDRLLDRFAAAEGEVARQRGVSAADQGVQLSQQVAVDGAVARRGEFGLLVAGPRPLKGSLGPGLFVAEHVVDGRRRGRRLAERVRSRGCRQFGGAVEGGFVAGHAEGGGRKADAVQGSAGEDFPDVDARAVAALTGGRFPLTIAAGVFVTEGVGETGGAQ